jgi:hypothetical protein
VFLGRVPVPGEALWTAEDRAWAIALLEHEADICSGCGQPASESRAPENEFHYETTVLRCHACKTVAHKANELSESKAKPEGLMIGVHLEGVRRG